RSTAQGLAVHESLNRRCRVLGDDRQLGLERVQRLEESGVEIEMPAQPDVLDETVIVLDSRAVFPKASVRHSTQVEDAELDLIAPSQLVEDTNALHPGEARHESDAHCGLSLASGDGGPRGTVRGTQALRATVLLANTAVTSNPPRSSPRRAPSSPLQ